MTRSILILYVLMGVLVFTSCEDDDPEIPNESELITTVRYTLTPEDGGEPVVFSYVDLDGEGGDPPNINTMPLAANTLYNATLELLDESKSPVENITEEIEEEDEEHQFFFSTNSQTLASSIQIAYTDMDAAGNPIGLNTRITTGDPASGDFIITLLHEPDKNAERVSENDATNAGGETDIMISFDMVIQ